jgi:hypothetical protein
LVYVPLMPISISQSLVSSCRVPDGRTVLRLLVGCLTAFSRYRVNSLPFDPPPVLWRSTPMMSPALVIVGPRRITAPRTAEPGHVISESIPIRGMTPRGEVARSRGTYEQGCTKQRRAERRGRRRYQETPRISSPAPITDLNSLKSSPCLPSPR